MKFTELKIGTQLRIGFSSIFLFSIILGSVAWWQNNALWNNTKDLYGHPFQVRRAVGDLNADILSMHRGMKDLILCTSERQREQVLREIDGYETNANRQFVILYDSYLGPQKDIEEAQAAFVQWKTIREKTIRLIGEGNIEEATSRVLSWGIGGTHVSQLLRKVSIISDFATKKADAFYVNSQNKRNTLHVQLVGILCLILTISSIISYLIMRGIRHPLEELKTVTEDYLSGKWDVRSVNTSKNEVGTLSQAFNALAEKIATEITVNNNAVTLSGVMLREEELRNFCKELIKMLTEHTESQMGAIYFLNEEKTVFEHFESIGLNTGAKKTFSAVDSEGEFGVAITTRHIQHITKIPEDTRFILSTVCGDMIPREIITIPISSRKRVVALISIARVRSYHPNSVRLINDIHNTLTARIHGVLAFHKMKSISEKLEVQNRELETQKQELSAQSNELSEQNLELVMQKQRLDESNKLKSHFLANMSHELRTPLNSVIALSGVLNRRLKNKIADEEYSFLSVIERNGKNLLMLINDILDLSRIEAGKEEVFPQTFAMRELVQEVIEMIKPQADEKGIELTAVYPEVVQPIYSDREKCRHILQNLLVNAVKFTEQGKVEVTLQSTMKSMQIEVSDTGIGIGKEQLSIIFDEFRQADGSSSRKYGGTGLGLAISKKYAAILNGNIRVESQMGKGSTFTLSLPLLGLTQSTYDNVTWPARNVQSSSIEPSIVKGKTILLVEDSEPAIIQIKDFLSEKGYNILVSHNGREALDSLDQTIPDAVILDLMMPGVDGFEVLRKIREKRETSLLPVLILTAKHISKEELNFLKGNNVHQLIQKGNVSREDLLTSVQNMVCPPPKTTPKKAIRRATLSAEGKPRILIVEDNIDNLITLRAMLGDKYILFEARDGQSALEEAQKHLPSLILMDIALPKIDGFQALKQIREDQNLQKIPVVAVTASAMKGNREEILASGFDGYIAKPIDPNILEQTMNEMFYGDE